MFNILDSEQEVNLGVKDILRLARCICVCMCLIYQTRSGYKTVCWISMFDVL